MKPTVALEKFLLWLSNVFNHVLISEIDPDVVYMEPTGLLNLIKEKCTSFFVMDVRDSNDFKSSHVKYVTLINNNVTLIIEYIFSIGNFSYLSVIFCAVLPRSTKGCKVVNFCQYILKVCFNVNLWIVKKIKFLSSHVNVQNIPGEILTPGNHPKKYMFSNNFRETLPFLHNSENKY